MSDADTATPTTAVKRRATHAPAAPGQRRDEAIRRACSDHAAHWAEARRTGLTDPELRDLLSDTLGDGESGGPDSLTECHYGGKDPTIWLNVWSRWFPEPVDDGIPVEILRGKQLLAQARRVLAIPYPAGDGTVVIQGGLF